MKQNNQSRGLTLAELIIGLSVMSILLLALSAFTMAVGHAWTYSNQVGKSQLSSTRSSVQLDQLLRNSLSVVQVKNSETTTDTAHLFFWQADNNGGAMDGAAQLGEMALLEYEPSSKTLWYYAAKPGASMTTAEQAEASTSSWGNMTDPAIVGYFKQRTFLAARVPVVGTRARRQ
jgi:prepilin-type N-terminal cleavage/methylation domain-containing protein